MTACSVELRSSHNITHARRFPTVILPARLFLSSLLFVPLFFYLHFYLAFYIFLSLLYFLVFSVFLISFSRWLSSFLLYCLFTLFLLSCSSTNNVEEWNSFWMGRGHFAWRRGRRNDDIGPSCCAWVFEVISFRRDHATRVLNTLFPLAWCVPIPYHLPMLGDK